MKPLEIVTADGVKLAAHWELSKVPGSRGVVLVAPATGVRRRFYSDYAKHLAGRGFDVLLWDARGIGESRRGPARLEGASMRDWGERDLDAVIRHARSERPEAPLLLLGHSSGGHLAGLARSLDLCDGLALVAAGTCDWRDYPVSQWPRLWAVWWVAVPVLLKLFGYLPGWAGVGHDLPRGVAEQWRGWSLTPGYLFGDPSVDASGYGAFAKPLFALSLADDLGFSPPRAVRALLSRFSSAEKEHLEVKPEEGGGAIGHFGYFQRRHARLWPHVDAWLDRVAAGPRPPGRPSRRS